MHADRRRVDVDVAAGVAQFFHSSGDHLAGFAIEFGGQCVSAFFGAVVDDDGRSVVSEGGDGGAAGPASADDSDTVVGQLFSRDFQGRGDGVEDGGVVGG